MGNKLVTILLSIVLISTLTSCAMSPNNQPRLGTQEFPDKNLSLDLVVEYGIDEFDKMECVEGKNQVWFTSYPYIEFLEIVSDKNADILFPAWSPDGKWIAYVNSKPYVTYGNEYSDNEKGQDSVWIMHSDGSGKKQVGNPIGSLISKVAIGCYPISAITSSLIWSPDSRHILFPTKGWDDQSNSYFYDIFIVDTISGTTQRVLSSSESPYPQKWISEKSFILSFSDHMVFGELGEDDSLSLSEIEYPFTPSTNRNLSVDFQIMDEADVLFGFVLGENNLLSLYSLNLNGFEWKKANDLFLDREYNVNVEREEILVEAKNKIAIYDHALEKPLIEITIPDNEYWLSRKFIVNSGRYESMVFIREGNNIESGVWLINFSEMNPSPILFFNISIIPSLAEGMRIISVDVKPE